MMHAITLFLGLALFQPPALGFPALIGGSHSPLTATAKVTGPVTFELETTSGDVEVRAGSAKQVKITVDGSSAKSIKLVTKGKGRIGVETDNGKPLTADDITVEVPPGSRVELVSMSGDVVVDKVGGDAKVTTTAGDIRITRANRVDVTAVSGDLELKQISGPVHGRSVSGDARIYTTGKADAKLEFESTSGELEWQGRCGKGCSLEIKSLSGDVDLLLDKASSFTLDFDAHSGELDDDLGMKIIESKRTAPGGGKYKARYGGGDGSIQVDSFSGELGVRKP